MSSTGINEDNLEISKDPRVGAITFPNPLQTKRSLPHGGLLGEHRVLFLPSFIKLQFKLLNHYDIEQKIAKINKKIHINHT